MADIELGVSSSIGLEPEAEIETQKPEPPQAEKSGAEQLMETLAELLTAEYDEDLRIIPPRQDSIEALMLLCEDGQIDHELMGDIEVLRLSDGRFLVSINSRSKCDKRRVVISSPCENVYECSLYTNDIEIPDIKKTRFIRHGGHDCNCFKTMVRRINQWLGGKTLDPEPTHI